MAYLSLEVILLIVFAIKGIDGNAAEERFHDTGITLFGDWSAWTQCTVTCGGGEQNRERTVTVHSSGQTDTSTEQESQECNTDICETTAPQPVEYTDWSDWTECSVTCGGAVQYKSRVVTVTTADASYTSHEVKSQACNTDSCPETTTTTTPAPTTVYGEWSESSPCPVTCGGGIEYMQRSVTVTYHDGSTITTSQYQSQICNTGSCTETTTTTENTCKNVSAFSCAALKKLGWCTKSNLMSWMEKNCAKKCGFC